MKNEFFPSSEEKKPTTYDDVMASNNNNICTHFTLGCCSCTPTTINDTQPAIDSFNGARKSKFEEKETNDQRKKKAQGNEVVETMSWGYSTELMLYDDPWKIKKVLQKSDLGNLSRLLFTTELVEKLVLPVLGIANNLDAIRDGIQVNYDFDLDTKSMHNLVFKKWFSSGSYVFMGKWVKEFVVRRGLEEGDEIGLHWDPYNKSIKTWRT